MGILIPALIAAVVSILFGSVAAAIVSHFLTASRANKEYRLKKLEELFIAVQFWCFHLQKVYHNLTGVATTNLTWNEAVLRDAPRIEQAEASYATALMLSNVFFKDLTIPLERIMQLRDELVLLRTEFKTFQQDGMAFPHYREQFEQGLHLLGQRQNEFNEKLYRIAEATNAGSLLTAFKNYCNS